MGLPSNQDCISQIVELDIPNELAATNNNSTADIEVKRKQQQEEKRPVLRCPRCDSSNTKFCYYNNYSKMQPRHFCRACKRHWTAGGTLRNVPVGGARRNKRAKTNHDDNNKTDQNDESQQPDSSVAMIDTAIFPDIFRLLMSQPPLLPDVGTANENFYSGGSSLLNLGSENVLSNFMDGDYGIQGTNSAAQPPNFVNSWDHAWNLV